MDIWRKTSALVFVHVNISFCVLIFIVYMLSLYAYGLFLSLSPHCFVYSVFFFFFVLLFYYCCCFVSVFPHLPPFVIIYRYMPFIHFISFIHSFRMASAIVCMRSFKCSHPLTTHPGTLPQGNESSNFHLCRYAVYTYTHIYFKLKESLSVLIWKS